MEYHKHFRLNSMLKYITFTLFIASTITAEDIKPDYDKGTMKFFDARKKLPLVLQCNHSSPAQLTWEKNGTDINSIAFLKDRFQIKHGERYSKLEISETDVDDAGKYTCKLGSESSADIDVIALAYVKKMPPDIAVVEGEKLKIHCLAMGTDPEITWTIGNSSELDSSRVTLHDFENQKDAILLIEHAEVTDRNYYNCTTKNQATGFKEDYQATTQQTYVRVKGKLAALWPFLGICAEVIILCAIILVYEKRRNKEGLDESDTDQSPEQEKLKTGK